MKKSRWMLLWLALAPWLAQAGSDWSGADRLLAGESYDSHSKGIYFTLRPGEDAVAVARDCAETSMREGRYSMVTCYAFTNPARFNTVQGKLRVCYSAIANNWGNARPVTAEPVKKLPRICPSP